MFGFISSDEVRFWQDLMNIAGTTLSSKLLTHHKDHFTKLAVEAVLRLKGSGNLEAIHVIKKLGGSLADSYLDEGMYVCPACPLVPALLRPRARELVFRTVRARRRGCFVILTSLYILSFVNFTPEVFC